jgi:lsr operon transcriptional repressor
MARSNVNPSELAAPSMRADLIARICWLHFREGQTQQEVADRVGLSRMTVNKIISDAVEQGYVRITVETALAPCFQLETDLKAAFGLRDVVVVPSPADEGEVRQIVGLATGDYLSRNLQRDQILGLSWGGTIYGAAMSLQRRSNSGNVVVSLSGGLSKSAIINPYDNAATFARILDAECHYMTAPMFADDARMKNMLMSSSSVRSVLDMAKRIDVALLTAVDLTAKTWIIKHGALSPQMLKELVKAGSVGGVSDHYLDEDGNVVDHPINERTVTVPLDLIRTLPKIILAAGGAFKVPIIRAILRAKLPHVLITDEAAARLLLRGSGAA